MPMRISPATILQNSVIRKMVEANKKAKTLERQVEALKHQLFTAQKAAKRAERIKMNILSCSELLRRTRFCRNTKCGAEFCCYIDDIGIEKPIYFLRCRICQYKQTIN